MSQYRDCKDPAQLNRLIEAWHHAALDTIRTKDLNVTIEDFVRGWWKAKYLCGDGSLQAAWQRAQSFPLPTEAATFEQPEKRMLLALCRELQIERDKRAFYLSARDAASTIGLGGAQPQVKAHRWLKEFCESGLLRLERTGSQVRRLANEYRYLAPLNRVSVLVFTQD